MGMLDGKVFAQLYSLISTNNATENVLPALEILSKIGYDGVELMGANTCGMSVEGFRKHLESRNERFLRIMIRLSYDV